MALTTDPFNGIEVGLGQDLLGDYFDFNDDDPSALTAPPAGDVVPSSLGGVSAAVYSAPGLAAYQSIEVQPVTGGLGFSETGALVDMPTSFDSFDVVGAYGHRDGHVSGGGGGGGGPKNGGGGEEEPTTSTFLTSYTAGGKDKGPNEVFNIDIEFVGTEADWKITLNEGTADEVVVNLQDAFITAADYLTTIITQGFEDLITGYVIGSFSPTDPQVSIGKVDDLYMTAEIRDIDGAGTEEYGNVVGFGGYYDLGSTVKDLPHTGFMVFDTYDVASLNEYGFFDAVVLHEMLHVLGVGTAWERLGLVSNDGNYFTGAAATDWYENSEFWDGTETEGVPIDGGHWDEAVFDTALMTPSFGGEGSLDSAPLDLTLAALYDMGYSVVGYPDESMVV